MVVGGAVLGRIGRGAPSLAASRPRFAPAHLIGTSESCRNNVSDKSLRPALVVLLTCLWLPASLNQAFDIIVVALSYHVCCFAKISQVTS